jgi:hypothetical protein
VVARRAAERPECVLHPLGKGDEALATENDVRMFKTGIGEPEMVEPVIQRRPGDRDAEIGHVGEVR